VTVQVRPFKGRKGQWEVDVRVRMPDGRAVRRRVKSPLSGRHAAEAWGHALEGRLFAELRAPAPPPRRAPTIAEYAPRFLAWCEARDRAPGTVTRYRASLEHHIVPALGHLRLDAIAAPDLEALVVATKAAGLAPGSRRQVHKCLNRLLSVAEAEALAERLPRVWVPRPEPRPVITYSEAQVRALLSSGLDLRDRVIVLLGVHQALRRSEICGLRVEDFAEDLSRVTISRAVWRSLVRPTKSGKARTLGLTPQAREALRAYLGERGAGWLFTRDGERPWVPNTLGQHFHRACAAAGIPRLGSHALRRTAATRAGRAGVSPVALAAMLGHGSLDMARAYLAHGVEDSAAVVAALSGFGTDPGEAGETRPRAPCKSAKLRAKP
jgi:integrase